MERAAEYQVVLYRGASAGGRWYPAKTLIGKITFDASLTRADMNKLSDPNGLQLMKVGMGRAFSIDGTQDAMARGGVRL